MSTVVEPSREIPVLGRFDVVVVGGGPGGVASAIAASRMGARVALVERHGFLGGTATAMMVDNFFPFRAGTKWAVRGIAWDIVERLKALGAVEEAPSNREDQPYGFKECGRVYFHTETLKVLLDRLMEEYKIFVILHTLAAAPLQKGNRVEGIVVESKSGRRAILAPVVIDGSGDGDIAYRAGAPFEMRRPGDGLQPMTLEFVVSGIDRDRFREYLQNDNYGFRREIQIARARGEFVGRDRFDFHRLTTGGVMTGINVTRMHDVDPTDSQDLTRAEIEGRRQATVDVAFLRKYIPGFKECEITAFATQAGARESRRFVGGYMLEDRDLLDGSTFEDSIAVFPSLTDIHDPEGWKVDQHFPNDGEVFEIPYRCLVPEEVDGILIVGKCISATSYVEAATRFMICSMATGQAAGVAAALCAAHGMIPREVDVRSLRTDLLQQGAIVSA
jgi:hypothetical protein